MRSKLIIGLHRLLDVDRLPMEGDDNEFDQSCSNDIDGLFFSQKEVTRADLESTPSESNKSTKRKLKRKKGKCVVM